MRDETNALYDPWRTGDAATGDALIGKTHRRAGDRMFGRWFVDRPIDERDHAVDDAAERELALPGRAFFAGGAWHLFGESGLVREHARRGARVTRPQGAAGAPTTRTTMDGIESHGNESHADEARASRVAARVASHAARAGFTRMQDSTQDDWRVIGADFAAYAARLPDRVLAHLSLLDGDFGGFPVDRLTHSLQTATRAAKAGRDDEYVVCALLHDIGDTLGAFNHPDIAAAIVKPFVSERNHWIVEKHGVFQGYYFFHHIGLDRDLREQFRGHPWFDDAAEFCAEYDAPAFDPDAETFALAEFEPIVRRVFARPKRSIYQPTDS